MRAYLALILFAFFSLSMNAQVPAPGFDLSNYGVRIEPDKRLITVLATLEMARGRNAAGVDEKLINTPLTENSIRFREQLLADNAGLNEDLRVKISSFVSAYKKRHPDQTDAEIVAPFIAMAYTLTPVPELGDPIITHDLPGNLLDVLDLAPLVREFYRKSTISSKMDGYLKVYMGASDNILRTSTRDMVSELLGYLHTRPKLFYAEKITTEVQKGKSKTTKLQQTSVRERERRFFVVPEKLLAKGNINFLNIRDDYYVIVPPETDLGLTEARRAFLQFVVDPIVLASAKETSAVRDWAKPLLEERRKSDPSISPDVFLAITRSLVAAIDVRERQYAQTRFATEQARTKITTLKTDSEKRAFSAELEKYNKGLADEATLKLYEDFEKGAVLSLYFAEQLKGVEESGFDIGSSLKDIIAAFDPAKETARISASEPARKRALAARELKKNTPEAAVTFVENPVTTSLVDIQKTIDARDLVKAEKDLKELLKTNPSEPRIYYNIGRVAGLMAAGVQDPDGQAEKLLEAKAAYSNVLSTATNATDKALLSLTYVALGRIYEFFDNQSYAIKLYDEALKLNNVTGGGYKEAFDAKQRLISAKP